MLYDVLKTASESICDHPDPLITVSQINPVQLNWFEYRTDYPFLQHQNNAPLRRFISTHDLRDTQGDVAFGPNRNIRMIDADYPVAKTYGNGIAPLATYLESGDTYDPTIRLYGIFFNLRLDPAVLFGLYYGYPPCCIYEYVKHKRSMEPEHFEEHCDNRLAVGRHCGFPSNTDYVPCECCLGANVGDIILGIALRRHCTTPLGNTQEVEATHHPFELANCYTDGILEIPLQFKIDFGPAGVHRL